jgi:hypothetical protein
MELFTLFYQYGEWNDRAVVLCGTFESRARAMSFKEAAGHDDETFFLMVTKLNEVMDMYVVLQCDETLGFEQV